jgi:hypothetical protein
MEDAAARRERLRSLREAANAADQSQQQVGITVRSHDHEEANIHDDKSTQEQTDGPVLKFRNYAPRNAEIDHQKASFCGCNHIHTA